MTKSKEERTPGVPASPQVIRENLHRRSQAGQEHDKEKQKENDSVLILVHSKFILLYLLSVHFYF